MATRAPVNTARIREAIKPYLPSGNRMPKRGNECGAVRLSIYVDALDQFASTPAGKWSGAYFRLAELMEADEFYLELQAKLMAEREAARRERMEMDIPRPSAAGYRDRVFDGGRHYTGD
jgi:hypothetical protein